MANEIVAWVEKKVGPPAEILKDAAAVADFIDASDVVVVGFFQDQARQSSHQITLIKMGLRPKMLAQGCVTLQHHRT